LLGYFALQAFLKSAKTFSNPSFVDNTLFFKTYAVSRAPLKLRYDSFALSSKIGTLRSSNPNSNISDWSLVKKNHYEHEMTQSLF
jgi:hypothetical protein